MVIGMQKMHTNKSEIARWTIKSWTVDLKPLLRTIVIMASTRLLPMIPIMDTKPGNKLI